MPTSPERRSLFRDLDDLQAWELLKRGEARGLEYIYRVHGKVLFNFGMKLYGKQEWVEDTLQELFVDLWRDRLRLKAVTSLRSYLLKAFKYKLIRQYGNENKWSYVDYDSHSNLEVTLPEESRIIAEQLSADQRARLLTMLNKLSIRQREVLHLLFQEGLSYEEVATVMEINVRSVYTLAWKSIRALRKLIADTSVFFAILFLLSF